MLSWSVLLLHFLGPLCVVTPCALEFLSWSSLKETFLLLAREGETRGGEAQLSASLWRAWRVGVLLGSDHSPLGPLCVVASCVSEFH